MENNRLHCEKNDLSLQTVHRLGDKIIHKTKKKKLKLLIHKHNKKMAQLYIL